MPLAITQGDYKLADHSLVPRYFAIGGGATFTIGTDNTAYSSSDVSGNWIPMVTVTLTNAQADFPKIVITAHIEQNTSAGGGANSTAYCRVQIGAAQKGQLCTSIFAQNGFGGGTTGNCLHVILTAGTDYTQGTGFSFDIAHMGAVTGGGPPNASSNVLGLTVQGVC